MDPEWLDSNHLHRELSRMGLFILAYELLKAAVVDGVKDFYLSGFDVEGPTDSADYSIDVLSLDRHRFNASLIWLQNSGAIDQNDVREIQELRIQRNRIAHEAPSLLSREGTTVCREIIVTVERFVRKIDNYWGRVNAEIVLDPEQLECVDMDSIASSRSVILGYIIDIMEKSDN